MKEIKNLDHLIASLNYMSVVEFVYDAVDKEDSLGYTTCTCTLGNNQALVSMVESELRKNKNFTSVKVKKANVSDNYHLTLTWKQTFWDKLKQKFVSKAPMKN